MRTRSPATAVSGWAAYWNARPLNATTSGCIAAALVGDVVPPSLPRYISDWISTYWRSTGSRPSGSITTAPNMPFAMCCVIGMVPQ